MKALVLYRASTKTDRNGKISEEISSFYSISQLEAPICHR